ncbi:MAG: glycosyltransferase 87 family protein [Acidimicrobiia bacterium]
MHVDTPSPRPADRARPAGPGGRARRRAVALVAAGLFVIVLVLWLVAARRDPTLLDRDWTAFDRAGDRVRAGGWAEAYRASAEEPLPFLYPPYSLWLTLPLTLLGTAASYAVVLASALVALAASGWFLRSMLPGRDVELAVVLTLSALSGPFLLVVVIGQVSASYVVAILAGTWLLHRGHRFAGGAVWSLLVIKPNLALPFALYLAVRGERRAVAGFGAGASAALLATVPMGPDAWRGFIDGLGVVGRMLTDMDNWYGQATVLAAVRSVLHPVGADWAAAPLWSAVCLPLGLGVLRAWRRAEVGDPAQQLRLVGTVCLVAVAGNNRLYAYDALLLVIPAAAWYLGRPPAGSGGTAPPDRTGWYVAAAFAVLWAVFAGQPVAPAAGLVSAGWLWSEVRALRAGRSVPVTPSAPCDAPPMR